MNKKLIKIIASITCGSGIASSIPFITTSCGSSKHTLAIDQEIGEINGIVGTPITSTLDLSQHVYIDNTSGGKVASELTFTTEPALPSDLSINKGTGVISGMPTTPSSDTYKIKVSAIVDGKTLSGLSNQFNIKITDNPTPTGYSIAFHEESQKELASFNVSGVGTTITTTNYLVISPKTTSDQIELKVEFDRTDTHPDQFDMSHWIDNFIINPDFTISFLGKESDLIGFHIWIKVSIYNKTNPQIISNEITDFYITIASSL